MRREPLPVEALGYRFLLYPEKYYEGIEGELNFELDTVTLPNDSGYYYSTLYGLDNVHVPFLAVFQPVRVDKKLSELVSLVLEDRMRRGVILRERKEDEAVIEAVEKVRRLEEVVFKGLVTRKVLESISKDNPASLYALVGVVKYEEEQKLRKLGNGFAVYLSEKVRTRASLDTEDNLRVKVVDDRIVIERGD